MLLTVPVTVKACEGECIVAITNAFLGNYSYPVDAVMHNMAQRFSDMLPSHPSPATTFSYLAPLIDAYGKQAYGGMETAIFPSYFHGKCQRDGVDPPGCPNPDCPVVCGTPGSMVHFYPKLRYIAFNQTRAMLEELARPGSPTYQQVEQNVMDAAQAHQRRVSRVFARTPSKKKNSGEKKKADAKATPAPGYKPYKAVAASSPRPSSQAQPAPPSSAAAPVQSTPSNSGNEILVPPVLFRKRSQNAQEEFKEAMAQIGPMLEQACGGDAVDNTINGLPECSWEQAMKEYILTFP
ncbi:hypothetical protein WOLCODRAFT_125366 [Wolfiporia cocos MD-104 SS10]|uniref:Uncharacterized protein n=1 Tax=Wolfiporia cocos (strain MD-104) TaxID=742152 RepID=A0A2H3JGD1_WOLCO|nr:hypothetical protein WOLCODRAFT_125366 [Wolfiporia cocos MD-104 SS10]